MVDQLLASALVPILCGAGYRKEQRTFRRASPECVQVVNVQLSQWGSRTSQQFTLNLGVFFPKVHEALGGYFRIQVGPSGPTEPHCQIRERLGMLMPEPRDLWCDIDAAQDPSLVWTEVGDALNTFGLPWLASMAEFDAARRAVEDWPLQALGFDLATGDVERARRRFRGLLQGSTDSSALRSWGLAKGLEE